MWVVMKHEKRFYGSDYYSYLTKEGNWDSNPNNAKGYTKKNSANVVLTNMNLHKDNNIIVES